MTRSRGLTSVALAGTTTYTYDPLGNRLSHTRDGIPASYAYDRADRITSGGAGGTYTVNANGNLTARGSDSFVYDQANRLVSATVGGTTNVYAYDGDGKRVSTTVGGITTRYLYDVSGTLPMLLDDGTRTYVWGLGLAYTVDGSGNVRVPHGDGLGSVRALSDSTPSVVQTYQTDEFGVPAETMGLLSQPLQYTGEQRDGETGFVYLRARVYDPQIGRFLQRDGAFRSGPGSQGLHRYTYVGNNPIMQTDPSGHGNVNPGGGVGGDDGIDWAGPTTADTPCASRGQGPGTEGMGGYVINAGCLETPLQTVVLEPVLTSSGLMFVPRVVSMTAPKDEGGTPTDRLKEHLTLRDLIAARAELAGEFILKRGGGFWHHLDEVRDAQPGLMRRIGAIKNRLGYVGPDGYGGIGEAQRAALIRELSEASRMLDFSERFVGRP